MQNALAAIAGAHHVGVRPEIAIAALNDFTGVQRRMDKRGCVRGITVYDDFAHHPTAIQTTLHGLRTRVGAKTRIIALLDLGSYTMRNGHHQETLLQALRIADLCCIHTGRASTELTTWLNQNALSTHSNQEDLLNYLLPQLRQGDQVLIMSNSGFAGIYKPLLARLEAGDAAK